MECARCGTCCVAPDIAALDKPVGVRCAHLTAENLCGNYACRPQICRDHRADELCRAVAAPTLEERAHKYLSLFGLLEEAERVKRLGLRSMRAARAAAGGLAAGAEGRGDGGKDESR